MSLRVKRAYEPPVPGDGARVLVDRLWPRGCTKEALALHAWMKAVTPSDALRRAYHGGELDFADFEARYRAELEAPEARAGLEELKALARKGPLTLVTANKDAARNHALVLLAVLEASTKGRP